MKNKRFKTNFKDFDLYKTPKYWEDIYHYQMKVSGLFWVIGVDKKKRSKYLDVAKKIIRKNSINAWLTCVDELSKILDIEHNLVEEFSLTSSLNGVLGIRHLTHLLFLSVDENIVKDVFWKSIIELQTNLFKWHKEAQEILDNADENVHTGIHNTQYRIEELLSEHAKKPDYDEIKNILETSLSFLYETSNPIDFILVKNRGAIGGFIHILSSTFLLLKTDPDKVRSDF